MGRFDPAHSFRVPVGVGVNPIRDRYKWGRGEVAQQPSTSPNRESFRSDRQSTALVGKDDLPVQSRRGGASHGDESTALVAKDDLPVASISRRGGCSSACGCRSQAVSLASPSGSHPPCQTRLFYSNSSTRLVHAGNQRTSIFFSVYEFV